ncbi:MAG TPA: glutamate synthase large subunit [Elusimicrobiota bacterium]|nr:glutamate synthase large subunit [Elusimicrobiota bacterium]
MRRRPDKQGLYDPQFEHDACGVGFVADLKGRRSNDIVRKALTVLSNLRHRGACGCEKNTGDGAGILLQIPHNFLQKVCRQNKISLPSPGDYGTGIVYMPPDPEQKRRCESVFEDIVRDEGQSFLGWRTVPTNHADLGQSALDSEPDMRQIFIGRSSTIADNAAFERKLYVIRRRVENSLRRPGQSHFYVTSLSSKTILYKGMLLPEQVDPYYPDLSDPAVDSAIAIVHSRFSTNTFPSWDRAHPYRCLAHNGEINTLRGNINRMFSREHLLRSDLFGDDLKKILPIIDPNGSDSAMFDNCLEFLFLTGRSLPHAMMMMIPEPWSKHESMSDEKKAFYEYHSCLMEPWDGPASVAFTDGSCVGAVLDRNGLRPSRYYVTKDGLVVMASEVGVIDIPADQVLQKGRLQPGRMFLIDTIEGRIINDDELKHRIVTEHPYREWLNKNMIPLDSLPAVPTPDRTDPNILLHQNAFGYTLEDLNMILTPMARDGVEPLGSMGNDAPLAVLSDKPQPLYNYFKQLFAQVTNPPIDAIREEIVTGTETMIGTERNILNPEPASGRQIKLRIPILTDEALETLRRIDAPGFKSRTLPMFFQSSEDGPGLEKALEELFQNASRAIRDGVNILILSDRGCDRDHAPIPALLAMAGLHHHLVREQTRMQAAIIVESGEPREVHHFALLIGYGAAAINPYLAYESIRELVRQGKLTDRTAEQAVKNYIKALMKGIVKVISKMGISTIHSYRGSQIFEAVGIHPSVVDRYFTGTPSRIGGIGMDVIAEESVRRHQQSHAKTTTGPLILDSGGQYQWRYDGERHLFNPQSVQKLQSACRLNDYRAFQEYASLINDQTRKYCTLRGLFEFKETVSVPLDEVESVESLMKRFKTGAMSYGSISPEAHETLAIAMNRIGGKSNTGEGGEAPERYVPEPNGDSRNSAIKQVASGRFGVTSLYLVNAKEIQIKIAQGAKPGEGGQLPGHKVYPWIARVRHSTTGVGLISPPPHHDIYSIEDLAELIHDLKNANPLARISVKLVSAVGVGTIAAGVAKAHADVVLISGYDGGTGASPLTSIKHAGIPWELGLSETHQTLLLNNLRDRIVVETDGQLKTGRDVAMAALLGAEEFGFATAPLVVMGCLMMRVCHLNTCPVGVATQDPRLRKNFKGDPSHVVNFMRFIAQDLREHMARLGFRNLNEMVGRSDLIEPHVPPDHWKTKGLDLSKILQIPDIPPNTGRYCRVSQDHGIDSSLDRRQLLKLCEPAIQRREKVRATLPIHNTDRVVGTITGSEITRKHGVAGLPDDTISLRFQGSAGQSFGAFIPRGMTLILEGDANDYLGKGLSGGKIIVYPSRGSSFVPEDNIIIGNVALYGATSGEAYIHGKAGERFCVRNSGVNAVVDSVGDHGCEYMTGGRVVVLGETGRNFAAGMSGGIAYVIDESNDFASRCNKQMVSLERLEDLEEIEEIRQMILKHVAHTDSKRAKNILAHFDEYVQKFVKVIPQDYKRVLTALKKAHDDGLTGDKAIQAAFEANARNLARVGGN